jgi:hypothetical protein
LPRVEVRGSIKPIFHRNIAHHDFKNPRNPRAKICRNPRNPRAENQTLSIFNLKVASDVLD